MYGRRSSPMSVHARGAHRSLDFIAVWYCGLRLIFAEEITLKRGVTRAGWYIMLKEKNSAKDKTKGDQTHAARVSSLPPVPPPAPFLSLRNNGITEKKKLFYAIIKYNRVYSTKLGFHLAQRSI